MASGDAALRYLQRDRLSHILHLKMLAYHGHLVRTTYLADGPAEGVLLLFPTSALSYDHEQYGDYDFVAMPVADSPALFGRLLDGVPDAAVVFKLIVEDDEAQVKTRFTGRRLRVFANFTAPNTSIYDLDPDVVVDSHLDASLVSAFAENGHTSTELAGFLDRGGKTLAIHEGGQPVSAGLIYPNFGSIWEVAALYTQPHARRRGYSVRIVRTALGLLQEHGRTPRFVVDAANRPSVRLAQAVGLEEFLKVIHCAAVPRVL